MYFLDISSTSLASQPASASSSPVWYSERTAFSARAFCSARRRSAALTVAVAPGVAPSSPSRPASSASLSLLRFASRSFASAAAVASPLVRFISRMRSRRRRASAVSSSDKPDPDPLVSPSARLAASPSPNIERMRAPAPTFEEVADSEEVSAEVEASPPEPSSMADRHRARCASRSAASCFSRNARCCSRPARPPSRPRSVRPASRSDAAYPVSRREGPVAAYAERATAASVKPPIRVEGLTPTYAAAVAT